MRIRYYAIRKLFFGLGLIFSVLAVNSQPITLDTKFKPNIIFNDFNEFYAIGTQSDSKIILGGQFNVLLPDSSLIGNLIRLEKNGLMDLSFNDGKGSDFFVNSIITATNDENYIGWNWPLRGGVYKLQKTGTVDTSFNQIKAPKIIVIKVAKQSDGKILLAGNYQNDKFSIIRLHPNGMLDTTFKQVIITETVVMGDIFSTFNNEVIFGYSNLKQIRVLSFNSDGSTNTSFKYNELQQKLNFKGRLNCLKLQEDGKILVGGEFKSAVDYDYANLIRLNSDGSLDVVFKKIPEFRSSGGSVQSIALLPDKRILLGGVFFGFNGMQKNILSLDINGKVDSSFSDPIEFNSFVTRLHLFGNGKLLVAGNFTKYGNSLANHIALFDTKVQVNIEPIFPNPTHGSFSIFSKDVIRRIEVFNAMGQLVLQTNPLLNELEMDIGESSSGIYYVNITTNVERKTFKLIKY
ncbi:MAG: T9SS type A sorting domain-containing protein [Flavobacteriales bacterium]|nr:T9SS type A sorting domain-containing protein [Flavobacteriales bacterium]